MSASISTLRPSIGTSNSAALAAIPEVRQPANEATSVSAAVAAAFDSAIPVAGGWIVAFCAFLFGYTTLIGWAYYGEQFLEYVFGRAVITPYRWIYCGLIFFGAIGKVEVVWAWGDLMNGLQIFPNLIGVIGLSGVAAKALRHSERGPTA